MNSYCTLISCCAPADAAGADALPLLLLSSTTSVSISDAEAVQLCLRCRLAAGVALADSLSGCGCGGRGAALPGRAAALGPLGSVELRFRRPLDNQQWQCDDNKLMPGGALHAAGRAVQLSRTRLHSSS